MRAAAVGLNLNPQAVAISHFAVIANVIQMSVHFRITDPLCNDEDKGMVPGDVGAAGKNLSETSLLLADY